MGLIVDDASSFVMVAKYYMFPCNEAGSIVYGHWSLNRAVRSRKDKKMKLRKLQTHTPGHLYLHSMPGRYEPLAHFLSEAQRCGIERIICLTSEAEIRQKSPEYFQACNEGGFPIPRVVFPIPDFGVPADKGAFYRLAKTTADNLESGKHVLVHCAGGIGRTGTFAGCVLQALGLPLTLLEGSGSYPETDEQLALIQIVG